MESDTSDTGKTQAGNTRKPPAKRPLRDRNWCFTLNNHSTQDIEFLCNYFSGIVGCRFVFQEELSTSGTPHLQGTVAFANARSFQSMKSMHAKWHVEKCKSLKDSIVYCTKLETRKGRVYHYGFGLKITVDPMNLVKWKYWQRGLQRLILADPHPRKIIWIWDAKGNTGKTTFAKHLVMSHGALYVSGKATDIKFAIAEMPQPPRIVIIDCPRTSQGYISYDAIESVKNGIFFSGKYKGRMYYEDIPHVIVLANYAPNRAALSEDRWKVLQLDAPETMWMLQYDSDTESETSDTEE